MLLKVSSPLTVFCEVFERARIGHGSSTDQAKDRLEFDFPTCAVPCVRSYSLENPQSKACGKNCVFLAFHSKTLILRCVFEGRARVYRILRGFEGDNRLRVTKTEEKTVCCWPSTPKF